MKRSIMFIMAVCGLSYAKAQTFSQGIGFTYVDTFIPGWTNISNSAGLTYSPRYNFGIKKDYAWSIGLPLTLGAWFSSSNQNIDHKLSYIVNIPLVLNLNVGAGSSADTKDRIGFFLGAGFGYQYGSYNYFLSNSPDAISVNWTIINYGPLGDIGMRIAVGKGTHNIEIRGMYMKALDETKANIFGGGAGFNF